MNIVYQLFFPKTTKISYYMADKIQLVTDIASKTAYTVQGSLVLSAFFDILNKNAAAFGVILGFLTFLTNLYFQYRNHKALSSKNHDEELT